MQIKMTRKVQLFRAVTCPGLFYRSRYDTKSKLNRFDKIVSKFFMNFKLEMAVTKTAIMGKLTKIINIYKAYPTTLE